VEESHDVDVTMLAPDFVCNPLGTLANPLPEFRFDGGSFRNVPHRCRVIVSRLRIAGRVIVLVHHSAIFQRSDEMSTPRFESPLPKGNAVAEYLTHTDLDPLRQREEFQKWVADPAGKRQ
jgi:hypothetical protein